MGTYIKHYYRKKKNWEEYSSCRKDQFVHLHHKHPLASSSGSVLRSRVTQSLPVGLSQPVGRQLCCGVSWTLRRVLCSFTCHPCMKTLITMFMAEPPSLDLSSTSIACLTSPVYIIPRILKRIICTSRLHLLTSFQHTTVCSCPARSAVARSNRHICF